MFRYYILIKYILGTFEENYIYVFCFMEKLIIELLELMIFEVYYILSFLTLLFFRIYNTVVVDYFNIQCPFVIKNMKT